MGALAQGRCAGTGQGGRWYVRAPAVTVISLLALDSAYGFAAADESELGAGWRGLRQLLENTTTVTRTTTRLADENFLCGEYRTPCEIVAKVPWGPDLWLSKQFSYGSDRSYTHRERGYFNRTACERDQPWMQIEYEGIWQGAGVAEAAEPTSLASIDVKSVWMTLWHREVCLEQVDGGLRCMQTQTAIKELCPCNGWDWAPEMNRTDPRKRNVGMFCMPEAQCPVIHQLYHHHIHYLSYRADANRVCILETSTDKTRGWAGFDKEPECYSKVVPALCRGQIARALGLRPGLPVALISAALASLA